jgi:hypothetical protein
MSDSKSVYRIKNILARSNFEKTARRFPCLFSIVAQLRDAMADFGDSVVQVRRRFRSAKLGRIERLIFDGKFACFPV